MKFKAITLLLCLTVLFAACSKDETEITDPQNEETPSPDPTATEDPMENPTEEMNPETYFTFSVASNGLLDSFVDNYIIVHDENGIFLDAMSFENGSELVFESEIGQTISDQLIITRFAFVQLGANSLYLVTVNAEVEKGSAWSLASITPASERMGDFEWTADFSTDWKAYSLYSNSGFGINLSNGLFSPGSANVASTISNDRSPWYPENNWFLSVIDANNDLKYVTFDNVQQNDVLTRSAEDFNTFDTYLPVNIPDHTDFFLSVRAFDDTQSFKDNGLLINSISSFSLQDPINSFNLGYLDRFNTYQTSASYSSDSFTHTVLNFGPTPSSISFGNPISFEPTNTDIANFEFTTDATYVRKESTWFYSSGFASTPISNTIWSVFSGANAQTPTIELPEMILEKYPEANLDLLEYSSSTLYLEADSQSTYLNRVFGSGGIQNGYMEESVRFNVPVN